ncbi:MAG: NAD(P)H-dependent oxidoreductase [Methanobrevibacter sp.]|uniref:flavodoxin family protein n=1 Tax=Methanobrevibacter sp. TaxID=66852 RepID=UPI0025E1E05B|nr:NAD(P)H-dependent oxidoreductase [Methanobrevibacter sp.]MBQ6100176.1 NAD(P)H-dependent oxidoreductase [Methanobrevibacter sp.]
MKYVIINGSPRKKNTWMMVKQAQKNIDGEFEEIHLFEEDIPFCKGCYNCIMHGEQYCPHKNQIQPIVDKLKDCDGIIIACPVYALNVTALLKNFLDHTAYIYHRPEFFTKKALIMVSTAGAGDKKVAKYLDETLRHWGVNKVYKVNMACGGKDELETEDIDKTSRKFNDDVKSKKLHSPKFNDVIFYNVWRAMAKREDGIPADIEFWHETGLVEYDFSPDIKLGIIKKIFAKIMFKFFKKVI